MALYLPFACFVPRVGKIAYDECLRVAFPDFSRQNVP